MYRGNGESVTVKDLQSTVDYSFGVFTLSPHGNYGEPVTISYRYDFPSEPTDYLDCAEISNSTEYEIPEDGWFRIDVIGAGGQGGNVMKNPSPTNYGNWATSGGGGNGGYSRSEVALSKGDILSISFENGVTVNNSTGTVRISVKNGQRGSYPLSQTSPGSGGAGGSATGGNTVNKTGENGSKGNTKRCSYRDRILGGSGASSYHITINKQKNYSQYGGNADGADDIVEMSYYYIAATPGNVAKVFISRGNTNISSQQ